MRALREWFNTHVVYGFLPVAILTFMCSPAAVAFGGTPAEARTSGARPVTLTGLTLKGWPVYIKLSGNGKRIVRVVAGIELPCSKGGSFTVPDKYTSIPVRHGRFRDGIRDSFTDEGQTLDIDDSVAGKVNRKRTVVSGTWQSKTVFHEADGSVDTCDSGVVKFTARR